VDELAWSPRRDLVPHPLWDDDCVACAEVDLGAAAGKLEGHRDRAGHQVEQLIAIGVHLAAVARVARDVWSADREPVDALRWPAGELVHDPDAPVGTIEANHLACQVDPSTWWYLLGRGHVVSSVPSSEGCSPVALASSRTGREAAGNNRRMTPLDATAIEESIADPAAFAVIFDRHASSLHRFLARRVEPADADNLLGDVFRIAFERRASFDTARESARPWLYGIATNLIARHRRSEGRRLRAMALLAARRADGDDDVVGDRAAQSLDAEDEWSTLVDAIEVLPDAERHTLLLYVWEDLSYEDIATALDVPVGTVRSRLNRARLRLRDAQGTDDRVPRCDSGHSPEGPAR
jgi:RNA polymerase sigma factor (sigma-70 family)